MTTNTKPSRSMTARLKAARANLQSAMEGWQRSHREYKAVCAEKAELLACTKIAYTILADIRHQWKGRHTAEGQAALCAMRDAIAKDNGRDPQDVQDEYTNAKLRDAA